MSEPFIGEIKIFAGAFAPRSYAFCNGQELPISQNPALFSLLGVAYGGDGRSNFRLPDLQDRFPVHPSPSIPYRGGPVGSDTVPLTENQIPPHSHEPVASGDTGTTGTPDASVNFAATGGGERVYGALSDVNVLVDAIAPAGGGQAHENVQPYLGVNFIIALQGVFPARS